MCYNNIVMKGSDQTLKELITMNSKLFENEIKEIQSEDYRDFIRFYFDDCVGNWFWKSGASSSGKFHPKFSQGEGGLARHTKAVVMVCLELLRLSSYAYMKDEFKDFAINIQHKSTGPLYLFGSISGGLLSFV